MYSAMHYFYHQVLQQARHNRMTNGEREAQLISRVYGNLRIEHPEITRELVRQRLLLMNARSPVDVPRR
jgi:hypothetical protein